MNRNELISFPNSHELHRAKTKLKQLIQGGDQVMYSLKICARSSGLSCFISEVFHVSKSLINYKKEGTFSLTKCHSHHYYQEIYEAPYYT